MPTIQRPGLAVSLAALPRNQRLQIIVKSVLSVGLAIAFLGLLGQRLSEIDFSQASGLLRDLGAVQWLTALAATTISFWAIGHYDSVVHSHLATGIAPRMARRAGATAIAISQTLGFGMITGTILRWRMLPQQTLWQSARLTALVALFFLVGWSVVTALVVLATPGAPFHALAAIVLCVAGLGLVIGAGRRPGYRSRWPNAFVMARLLALAAIDTVMACVALWVLCPPDLALPFTALLPAFLIAFGAGLVSGTPGGVGAFEITLLALLPQVPEAPLLAACFGWRAVYFAAPAMLGAAVAIRGEETSSRAAPDPAPLLTVTHARRAETALLMQGVLGLIPAGQNRAWLAGRTSHCLIGMLDPIETLPPGAARPCKDTKAIETLVNRARGECRLPVVYKCTARVAVAARQAGLHLRPVAREAWLDPRQFDLAVPARAGLRRKLRRAEAAGISVSTDVPDWTKLDRIAAQWSLRQGGERGFSMGRYCRHYLAHQRVYVASRDGEPIAFVSFHSGKSEWTLDLMRQGSSTPDGTLHLLIAAAIADAAARNLPRLSLAAVPLAALCALPKGRFAALVHRVLGGNHAGLAQFKSSFMPRWQTLYLAAPHRPGLALAGLEIARAIHLPPPLAPCLHDDHADYEIASATCAWHRGDQRPSA